MNLSRWIRLTEALKTGPHLDTFESLCAAYSEPGRHYHNASHISACLHELDRAQALASFSAEVEVALWFHDAIYEAGARDNEMRSAQWAVRYLSSAGVSPEACERVRRHIMETRHSAEMPDGDSALVVDIDLSILGQDPQSYTAYARNIRQEYGRFSAFLYRRGRRLILEEFLRRPWIYTFPLFRERFEDAARTNIAGEIAELNK